MSDDAENKETAPESTEPEKVEIEPQVEEVVSEPEVTEAVPETVAETTPEVPLEAQIEPVEPAPKTETAQMGGNEPLEEKVPAQEKEEREPRKREEKEEPPQKEKLGLLRQMAQATIQLRIQKKLIKIMELFAKQTEITNDEVEKLLHVSDATATQYLAELEKRGKIRQAGTTGRGVKYVKR
jgi:hypothetical protein